MSLENGFHTKCPEQYSKAAGWIPAYGPASIETEVTVSEYGTSE